MIEIVQNIGSWLQANWQPILTALSTVDLASIAGAIVLLIKSKKSSDGNTAETKKLNENLEKTSELKKSVDDSVEANKELAVEVRYLKEENEHLKESNNEILHKLSSVLDVMAVVYSTIRDDTIRTTVNNIITDAKYTETATRAELERQVKDLQEKVKEDAEQMMKAVAEKAESVKTLINPGKNNTNVRY